MIGGNLTATIQVKETGKKNSIGERVNQWVDVTSIKGFLDFSTGDTLNNTYNAKIQESTHIFICDYQSLTLDEKTDVTPENARLIIEGRIYDIKIIDDPMNLHQHLEIYLKFVGGQNG